MDISKLPVIPQYLGTCWFNAILMSLLYSDGCQETLYNIAIRDGWNLNKKGESFKFLLFTILNLLVKIKRETNEDVLEKLYEKLKEFYKKNKVEKIFLKYAYKYDYDIRDRLETGYFEIYIITFLKNLGISVLDVTENEEKKYIGYLTYFKEYILHNKNVSNKIQELLNTGIDFLIYKNYNKTIPDYFLLNKYENYNLIAKYNLNSVLLRNYDRPPTHVITGITYENNYYVYNGHFNEQNEVCKLMLYNWKSEIKDFSIDYEKCELVEANKYKLCYNFNQKFNRTNIYTLSQKIKQEITDVESFRNLSHIISHINHYYDDLLHSNNKQDIIKKIKEFEEYKEYFEHLNIKKKEEYEEFEEYIEYFQYLTQILEQMTLEDLKELLKSIIYTHFYLDKSNTELQDALTEAKRIKEEVEENNTLSKLNAQKEANKIIEEAIEEAEKQQEKIIKDANEHAKIILENAIKEAEKEREKIIKEAEKKEVKKETKSFFNRFFKNRNRINPK